MKKIVTLLLFLLGLSVIASAQTSRGTVSGVISDSAGALIPSANITLTNIDTGVSRTSVTNDEGFYRFDAVDLGTYSMTVTATNFGIITKTNIIVNANQIANVDAQLTPGGQQVTVDVTAEAGSLLQTEAPVRGGNIEQKRITELPIASRNPVSLALTLPGVSSNRNGPGIATFSVNGARGRSNNFLIDGTENNDISVAGQGFQITNPDAVQEVSVQTSNFDAEFGRAGGAVVNVITKSGGNDFHGTASFFYDTTYDDALTSRESRNATNLLPKSEGGRGGHPPSGTETIYSGTIGGPIVRNRTFFFGAYQDDRQRSTATSQITTLTQAGRDTLRSIFPAGTNANVDSLLALTQTAIAPSGASFLALGRAPADAAASSTTCPAPAGNRPCVQIGSFFRSFASLFKDQQWQVRIDHKLGENDQLSGRFLSDRQDQPFGGTIGAATYPGFDADFLARNYNFMVAETHVFSPVMTNELRIAYNRIQLGFALTDPEGAAGTQPLIDISSLSALGADTVFPQGRTANNYLIQDTMTHIRGDHTFRFGADFLRQISTQSAPSVPRGQLVYRASTGRTALGNFVDDFGGSGGQARRDFGSPVYFPQLYRIALFFQDRWKTTEALMLTLGVRYEYFGTPFNSLMTPAFTGLFNVDPVTRTGPFSVPNRVHRDTNNFAPVFGIAYSPSFTSGWRGRLFGDKQTVFRAGYQIGYDSFFNNIASNAAASSPNLIATLVASTATGTSRGLGPLTSFIPTVAAPVSALSSQTLVDPGLVNPYMQRWSVGLQRALPFNLMLDVAYVGSKGTKLFFNEDRNPVVPLALRQFPAGITAASPDVSTRLDPLQGARLTRTNGGSSIFHSGQLQVTRRFTDNFTITGAYTWSKLIDNGSDVFGIAAIGTPQNTAIPPIFGGERLDRAVSLFDRRHRASFTYLYSIPFMREQRGVLGRLLGGFEISGVTTFESGVPLNIFNGVDADGIGGNFDRPDVNPLGQRGVRAMPSIATATFNPCSVAVGAVFYQNPDAGSACINPASAQYIGLLAGSGRTGNLGRNTELGPGTNDWNVNILKRTKITENTTLEFRTEFFNIFNHPQYLQKSISPFSPLGGAVPTDLVVAQPGEFLNPNTRLSDGGGRVIRYQLKFIF